MRCLICGDRTARSKHHLEPVSVAGLTNETVKFCLPCHYAVHWYISNEDLYFDYNTLETIVKHPDIKDYIGQGCPDMRKWRKEGYETKRS